MSAQLNVPLRTSNREESVEMIKRWGAKRVFVAMLHDVMTPDTEEEAALLKEAVEFWHAQGLEIGQWCGGLGMGEPLPKACGGISPYRQIVDVEGRSLGRAFCPTDAAFTARNAERMRFYARAGVDIIMLDDDLCQSVRPGIGCCCEAHLAMLEKELGERLELDQIKKLCLSGAPSRYRDAWLKVQGDSLRAFCKAMRAAVDEINPEIRLGFCSGYTSWDLEGADAIELSRILAGNTKPFVRLSAAPYWNSYAIDRFQGNSLIEVIENARLQASWIPEEIEFFHEGDPYPRNRYHCAGATLECYDLPLYADGIDGLKYMLNYSVDESPHPDHTCETIYQRAHDRHAPLREFLAAVFEGGRPAGVRILEYQRKFAHEDLPPYGDIEHRKVLMRHAFSPAAAMAANLSLPTRYSGQYGAAFLFGANAKLAPDADLRRDLILDLPAARYLAARGIDTGLISAEPAEAPIYEQFGERKKVLNFQAGEYYKATLKEGANVQSLFLAEEEEYPASYRYKNEKGQRFLVFCFDAYSLRHDSDVFRSYYRERQIHNALHQWDPNLLPVVCPENPGLYILTKETPDGLAVLLVNISLDRIDRPKLFLSRRYQSANCCGGIGELLGNTFRFKTDITPYEAVALFLKNEEKKIL